MFIEVQGHHVSITQGITDYINKKFECIKKHDSSDMITTIRVFIKLEKGKDGNNESHKAEGLVRFKGKQEACAEAITADMYQSIDKLAAKLDRLVKEHKEKQQGHGSNSGNF